MVVDTNKYEFTLFINVPTREQISVCYNSKPKTENILTSLGGNTVRRTDGWESKMFTQSKTSYRNRVADAALYWLNGKHITT